MMGHIFHICYCCYLNKYLLGISLSIFFHVNDFLLHNHYNHFLKIRHILYKSCDIRHMNMDCVNDRIYLGIFQYIFLHVLFLGVSMKYIKYLKVLSILYMIHHIISNDLNYLNNSEMDNLLSINLRIIFHFHGKMNNCFHLLHYMIYNFYGMVCIYCFI